MNEHILVVDDEKEIADLVSVYLTNEAFTVHPCYTAGEALACLQNQEIDLAVLDIMLPDLDGFSLCRKIREQTACPIIMLTAKDQEIDTINALSLGADDYMTKPFRPLELVARVKAQLRRFFRYSSAAAENESCLEVPPGLSLNLKTHECFLNEQPLSLTPTEFELLRILCQKKGSVVSAEELFHALWGDEYYSKSNNTIPVHIRHLREKLHDSAEHPAYIKTVWGVGYKIEQ